MPDPTLSEIMEDHASGRSEWTPEDVDALVTEIERQASEIERLRIQLARHRVVAAKAATVTKSGGKGRGGYVIADKFIERLRDSLDALNEKEPHADA